MFEILRSLEMFPRNELYFHNVFGNRDATLALVTRLRSGKPHFCLRGRGVLSRAESVFGTQFEGGGGSMVFHIPNMKLGEVITPLYKSPFETDDITKFPNYFTYVLPLPPDFFGEAEEWIREQAKSPGRIEYLNATPNDVRILPAQYFLGLI